MSAAQIRSAIARLGNVADVDGDNDFDANDSFLIHLVKLSGTDFQIDQSKGSSSLSATQIRANIDALSGGAAASSQSAQSSPVLQSVAVGSMSVRSAVRGLFRDDADVWPPTVAPAYESEHESNVELLWEDFREWIDAI